jgi:aspartate racemase
LVSIVAATLDAAIAGGFERPGLIGTRFTMEGGFYQQAFRRRGLEIVLPEKEDLALVHTRYVNELVPGKFSPDTRAEIVRVIERLRDPGARIASSSEEPSCRSCFEGSQRRCRCWTRRGSTSPPY